MKICADENISPRLVEIVNDLSTIAPRLLHISEIGAVGVKDRIWVRVFAEQNGDAIISGDAAMSRRQAELIAIGETGIKLLILPAQYQQSGIWHKQLMCCFGGQRLLNSCSGPKKDVS